MKHAARAAIVTALSAVALSGCGSGGSSSHTGSASIGVLGRDVKPLAWSPPAKAILGLSISRENVSKPLQSVPRTYATDVAVFSFRKGKLLEATLQVSKLTSRVDSASPSFQKTVVYRIGASTPTVAQVGRQQIYITTGTGQRLIIWFRGHYFFVMAVRQDFNQPRALLRAVAGFQP